MATQDPLPVVIVGAGPTGLMCALALGKQGIPVILLEAELKLAHDLRAGSFHPPTLEMMASYGITDRMLQSGIKVHKWEIRARSGELVAQFDLDMLASDTDYPFRLHLEQHRLTPILLDLIREETGTKVRFDHRVSGVRQLTDRVRVDAEVNGEQRSIDASWVIAADGGRSSVRKSLGVEFQGFTWPEQFLVVSTPYNFAAHGFAMNMYVSDPVEWIALFKMPDVGPPGLWRVVFPSPPQEEDEALKASNVERELQGFVARSMPYEVRHKTTYSIHQRVARTFRVGRVLLAGDAAHVNNPIGAFGLNSGIHDAVNLSDKLGKVWRGEADESLLELYARQRRFAAVEHVEKMSIRNLRMLEERDPDVQQRNRVELGAISKDPKRARQHLLESSMIASVLQSYRVE